MGAAVGALCLSTAAAAAPVRAAWLAGVALVLVPAASAGSYSHWTTPEVTMYTASGLLPG